MKIINKQKEKTIIGSLKIGDTFIYDHELYMFCEYYGDDIYCPRCEESINISEEIYCMAVCLADGKIYDFTAGTEVLPVECELMVL